MRHTFLSLLLLAAAGTAAHAQSEARWLRDAQISPDGSRVAFCYKGDVYTVGIGGGEARRLTTQPSYEATPLWSPDGQTIVFTSDRFGNADIFAMPATGGTARRLTYDSATETPTAFTPDGKHLLYNASIQKQAESMLFATHSSQTEVYKIALAGGRPVQVLGTPAEAICFTPDGRKALYQNKKGGENEWRKHHTSSIARDIWLYDLATRRHQNITRHAGEDRQPVLSPDGKTVYFLSERDGGSFNVYSFPYADATTVKAVTAFKDYPVRFLSVSKGGLLCFTYDGDIYTMQPGGQPKKISVTVTRDDTDAIATLSPKRASGAAVSRDGKQVAFTSRGEIFATVTGYSTTRQITHTAAAEAWPAFAPNGRTIVYSSYRDGLWQLYRSTISRKDDHDFANAVSLKEERVLASKLDQTRPQFSPDGKELAFIEGRTRLVVLNLATGKTRQVTDGTQWFYRTSGFTYQWSPDSRWFTLEFVGNGRSSYEDVGIVSAQGGKIFNVTESGYASSEPQWVMGGEAILFASDRYGMRNHASWGSEYDAFLVFMNRDGYDRARLSEEDYKLLKEAEAANKKKAAANTPHAVGKQRGASAKGKQNNKASETTEQQNNGTTEQLNIEFDGLRNRIIRVTPNSSHLSCATVSKDGETLYFVSSSIGKGSELWAVNLVKKDMRMLQKISGGGSMELDKDGNIFILGAEVRKMDAKTQKIEPVTFAADMELNLYDEREFILSFMRHEVSERLLYENYNGAPWDKLLDHYAAFLPHIANDYDFSELLSEILGELNLSHTGSKYNHPSKAGDDATAQLGLLFDRAWTGRGAKVTCVLPDGPFDRKTSRCKAGAVITTIDGVELKADMDIAQLLNHKARKKTLVAFADGHEEMVIPITRTAQSTLLYKRWVRRCEHIVDSVSGGRLGYVHIQAMGDPSFRTIYSAMLGKFNLKDGCVIDTRWNGGGRLHEDVEVLTSGHEYLTQWIRGSKIGAMPSRRYNKPTIMLQGESNYSNAHGTPWVYRHMNIGKLVGAPVPGTMTTVNWVTTQDPAVIFGIPIVGFLPEGGNHFLENTQLEPDILVLNDPAEIVAGHDQQLIAATKELMKTVSGGK